MQRMTLTKPFHGKIKSLNKPKLAKSLFSIVGASRVKPAITAKKRAKCYLVKLYHFDCHSAHPISSAAHGADGVCTKIAATTSSYLLASSDQLPF
jgi:hypothetical protein